MRKYFLMLLMPACLLSRSYAQKSPVDTLRQHFLSPPASAQPWVFWYWMQGAVSKEGITADLEAMKEEGIGGAYLMPIKDTVSPPYIQPPARQLSKTWWQMVRFAEQEAKRLGLHLAIHLSDGFALGGGPWITPELSMQKINWSQVQVDGNRLFNDTLPLPPSNENYYRDIAVFAFRERGEGTAGTANEAVPVVSTNKPGINAQFLAAKNNKTSFSSSEPCWIQYAYDKPVTCRTIIIHATNNYQAQRLLIEASDDGRQFHRIARLEAPRHGWQDTDADVTHTIASAT
ncbi:MAG TPA: glycosyl hydrolase, partial [Chitinophagaceae bacterium]